MNVKFGDHGADVLQLQRWLNELGFPIAMDGWFGNPKTGANETGDAVGMFQRENGLKDDEWVGDKTTAMLEKRLAEKRGEAQRGAEGNSGDAPMASEPALSPPFPPMSSAKRAAIFGRFDWVDAGGDNIRILGNWERENIQKFYIPQLDGVPYYEPGGGLECKGFVYLHKLAGPIFQRFFQRIEDAGLLDRIKCYDGAFVPRRVRGGSSLSNHAWGTAMDINAYANPYHREPAPLGVEGSVIELVPIAHECGLYWGGNFSGRSVDGMHFEVAVLP